MPRTPRTPRSASSSTASPTRSATDIGSTRSASRNCSFPRCRRPFNTVSPPVASARDGDARSGGSVAWTRARNAPSERILRSKAMNESASRGLVPVRSPIAVRTGSRHKVTLGPSADGAKAATSGSMARKPCWPSLRSRRTSSRRPPTQSAAIGARTPGATSSVARGPPARPRRSRTNVRSPAFARYDAATRPLWPAPTTTASYRSRATSSRLLGAERAQHLECREASRRAHDPAARVRGRAAHPEVPQRRAIARPSRHGPVEEELLE